MKNHPLALVPLALTVAAIAPLTASGAETVLARFATPAAEQAALARVPGARVVARIPALGVSSIAVPGAATRALPRRSARRPA